MTRLGTWGVCLLGRFQRSLLSIPGAQQKNAQISGGANQRRQIPQVSTVASSQTSEWDFSSDGAGTRAGQGRGFGGPPGFSSMVQQLLFVQGRDYHDCILQSRNPRPCQLRSALDSRPGSFPQEFRLLITTQSLTLNKPRTLHAGPPSLHPPQGGAG